MALTTESALRKDKRSARHSKMDAMQHRHFAVIAGIIANIPDKEIRFAVTQQFVAALANTNSRFDRARFMRACGADVVA
jgi:enamine deaminase RidA (YjgF/YER057c/UK114 family)